MTQPNHFESIINHLIDNLPEIAEEGGYSESKSIHNLVQEIRSKTLLDQEVIRLTLDIISMQFKKLGLLDSSELENL